MPVLRCVCQTVPHLSSHYAKRAFGRLHESFLQLFWTKTQRNSADKEAFEKTSLIPAKDFAPGRNVVGTCKPVEIPSSTSMMVLTRWREVTTELPHTEAFHIGRQELPEFDYKKLPKEPLGSILVAPVGVTNYREEPNNSICSAFPPPGYNRNRLEFRNPSVPDGTASQPTYVQPCFQPPGIDRDGAREERAQVSATHNSPRSAKRDPRPDRSCTSTKSSFRSVRTHRPPASDLAMQCNTMNN